MRACGKLRVVWMTYVKVSDIVTKKLKLSKLTSPKYTLVGEAPAPCVGRRNDKKPFSFGTSCETPTILPSDPYAVIPPSTMLKFLAMIDSEFMDSALCVTQWCVNTITSRRVSRYIPQATHS